MKFAAIADVHGNCVALEAVLADIAALGISDVVNLGDHVSGPLEPRRTVDLLMQRAFRHFEAIREAAVAARSAFDGAAEFDVSLPT
jgi:hypothetical protein